MSEPLDELAAALGGELGAQAARIERDLKLQFAVEIERLRAERAEFELRIERAVAERLASLKDGQPGPQGEDGVAAEAPDDFAPIISKAIVLLAEAPVIASPQPQPHTPAVVNVTVPAPRTERTRVTKHDAAGRILEIERDVA